jgi:hypothetical protein
MIPIELYNITPLRKLMASRFLETEATMAYWLEEIISDN